MADKARILVVDDEPELVQALKIRLEATGYEVITAADGQEGLQKARAEGPDLIILDVMLPKVDGYKVCRLLKFDERFRKIPIMMLTARAQDSDVATGMSTGADKYMVKPFVSKELVAEVRALLKRSEAEQVKMNSSGSADAATTTSEPKENARWPWR